jgi:Uma2 family endonuclease
MLTSYFWTIDRWHKVVESGALDGEKVELIDGKILPMSPEKPFHSYQNRKIGYALVELLGGLAYVSQSYPITLDNSEPEPDIAVVRLPEDRYKNSHPTALDIFWLIEISNTTLRFDLTQKAEIYARNNIPEYWVLDIKNNKLIIHTLPLLGKYSSIENSTSKIVTPLAFPQVKIDVSTWLG